MLRRKLEQSKEAHQAICEWLASTLLSVQMRRQLKNLKKLLEIEIADLESKLSNDKDGDGNGDGVAAD